MESEPNTPESVIPEPVIPTPETVENTICQLLSNFTILRHNYLPVLPPNKLDMTHTAVKTP